MLMVLPFHLHLFCSIALVVGLTVALLWLVNYFDFFLAKLAELLAYVR